MRLQFASSYSSGFVGWCSSLSLHLSFTIKYIRLAVTPTSRNTSTMTSVPSVPPTASQLNDDGLVAAIYGIEIIYKCLF